MKMINKFYTAILLSAFIFTGCKKEAVNGLSDIRPAVPVTVANAADYRPDPTIIVSKSAGGGTGPFQIVLTIPSNKGKTIKEISKVAFSTSYTQIQSTGTTGFYTTTPIPGDGTTVTFTSSFSEILAKGLGPIPATNAELTRRFYFLVTLSDDTKIVTTPVRLLVAD
ncbi:MAG: hypothetical protein EKK37_09480 [Sphingobacteriales bacterium]|nr:MAG: hypothetical protein EKK37_09480 [Sphingobacteriales bacterium]